MNTSPHPGIAPAEHNLELYETFGWSLSARSELLLALSAISWVALMMAGWTASALRLAFNARPRIADTDRDL